MLSFRAARLALRPVPRWFSSKEMLAITDVRKGMILKIEDGKYWEVKDWQPQKQGRGAASYNVTYDELETGKEKTHKFGSSAKVTKIEPDRDDCQVAYLQGERDEKSVVLADEDFNEVELPLSRFNGATVGEGTKVVLYKDDGEIIKVSV
eukprot:CAMPEP_0197659176 /NCGR_PEP_ID=MMETSP1338-20131121/46480_1 /TAXON_ID=43686 ORGANISM="Pelagodinium beii, Strain RCC1491" /NCGR_SAMPLE_ID=MMETSP1338 /ASSEMBLY_ACC=CAM_ASM_000754 /LENGTH=149 /DNA_ID=CAMNT_0043235965 /DNA_START=46 /DNA_END=492 /DNA_ORIENTATION=+